MLHNATQQKTQTVTLHALSTDTVVVAEFKYRQSKFNLERKLYVSSAVYCSTISRNALFFAYTSSYL